MELSKLYNYSAVLIDELSSLQPVAAQCFANLCIERLLPATALVLHELTALVENVLQESWTCVEDERLPVDSSTSIDALGDLLEELFDRDEWSFKLSMAEDTIYAIENMLRHLHSLDLRHAAMCGRSTFTTVTEFAAELYTEGYIITTGFEPFWRMHVAQRELLQQKNDIHLLKSMSLTSAQLAKIRQQAQGLGRELLQDILQYEKVKEEAWKEAVSSFSINSLVDGYIKVFRDEGVMVMLGEHMYGVIEHQASKITAPEWRKYQRRRVTATVLGYDHENQRVLLGSPQYHLSSVPLYLDNQD